MRKQDEPKGFKHWNDTHFVAPDRVKVYYNLQKECLSVVDTRTGRLFCHSHRIELKDAKFHVNENGRQKVLREKRKNVHAYVIGKLVHEGEHLPYSWEKVDAYSGLASPDCVELDGQFFKKVWGCDCRNEGEFSFCENCIPESGKEFKGATYNPYKYKTFVNEKTKRPVLESPRVILRDRTALGPLYSIYYIQKKKLAWNAGLKYTHKQLREEKV